MQPNFSIGFGPVSYKKSLNAAAVDVANAPFPLPKAKIAQKDGGSRPV